MRPANGEQWQEPVVSVLIPTHDRPDRLREAIGSVTAQTFRSFELLVGDDGNQAARVIDEAADERIRLVDHPHRLGIARNWEALVGEATGRYIAFLMDDDTWEPDFLRSCVGPLDRDAELGVCFANHAFSAPDHIWVREIDVRPGRHDQFAAEAIMKRPVAISAAVIRAAHWRDVARLPDTGAADIVVFVRLAAAGRPFFYVDRPLMTYGVHAENYSASARFRDEGVAAWSAIEVPDGPVRRLRDQALSRALQSRARLALQQGELEAARLDVRQAQRLEGWTPPLVALRVAAAHALIPRTAMRIRRGIRA